MQTVGDSLHEMSNPVFWNKSEKKIKMSSVDFVLTVQLACVIIIFVNM